MSSFPDSGRHFISTAELTRADATLLLDTATEIATGSATLGHVLANRVVANVFLEASTRTRLSFELAARRLGATVLTLTEKDASVRKGETLRDTLLTLQALGADAIVLRHPVEGAPQQAAKLLDVPVVNAGDGDHDHPTQALVDAFTLRTHFGHIEGLRVVIAGDVRHGRGAHANAILLDAMGAEVTLVAPPALLPDADARLPARMSQDLDAELASCDVVLLQRVQFERHPRTLRWRSWHGFNRRFGLTAARLRRMPSHAVVLHPGPLNRGIEIASEVADDPRSLMLAQVEHAVPVRMAILAWLFGVGPAS